MNIDNARIESVAVDTVNSYISEKTRFISGELHKGDTGISIDGQVIHFTDDDRKVSTFNGAIPVQIKGKKVQNISEYETSFSKFDLSTFKNFLKYEGVLVFVVEEVFTDEGYICAKQIFYKYLDSSSLVTIIRSIERNNKNTKTIYLEKLTDDIKFDEMVEQFLAAKISYPPVLSLYKEKMVSDTESDSLSEKDYKEALKKFNYEIRQSDFYDRESEFLKQVLPTINNIIFKDFIFPIENAIYLSKSFLKDNNYEHLPNDIKNKILIFLAKISNAHGNFDDAKQKISEINNIEENLLFPYKREKFISEAYSLSQDEAENFLSTVEWNLDYQYNLYTFYYQVIHNKISVQDTDALVRKNKYPDYLYLAGIFYSKNFDYFKAEETYSLISNFGLVKVQKITAYYNAVFSLILQNKNSIYLDKLKKYHDELQMYLDEIKKKNLNILYGESILNSIKSLIEPSTFISGSLSESDEKDKCILQALIMVNQYNKVIDYLIDKNLVEKPLLQFLLLLSLQEERRSSEIVDKIKLIIAENSNLSEQILSILTDFFVIAAIQNNSINDVYLIRDSLLLNIFHYTDIFLFKLKHIGYLEKEDKDELIYLAENINTRDEAEAMIHFSQVYNSISFAKKVYEYTKKIEPIRAAEMICEMLYFSDEESNLLEGLEICHTFESDNIKSERLLIIEIETYLKLKQFKPIIQLICRLENPSDRILSYRLAVQITLEDKTEIEFLINRGNQSEYTNFQIDAALAMIIFNVNPVIGSQILLKKILEANFENERINQAYVSSHLMHLREFDDEKELSKISGNKCYFLKLRKTSQEEEYITLPSDWSYFGEEYKVLDITDPFIKMATAKSMNTIEINKNDYEIIEKIPISTFVFRKLVDKLSDSMFMQRIDIKDGLEPMFDILKERESRQSEILTRMSEFGYTGFIELLVGPEDIILGLMTLLKESTFEFKLGSFSSVNFDTPLQMSLSSLVFLKNYNIEKVLKKYSKVYIDFGIIKEIQKSIEKEIESDIDSKRIGYSNGQPFFVERTSVQYQEQIRFLHSLLELKGNFKVEEKMFVFPYISDIFPYDAFTLQTAVDESRLLVVEDAAIQSMYESISVLGMIHNYYIESKQNIEEYLGLLIKLHVDNNLILLNEEQIKEILELCQTPSEISQVIEYVRVITKSNI